MKDILTAILRYRTERGWSEYQLAVRAGMEQSTISSWYCKKSAPTLASLGKICNAFGITLSQLLAEDDDLVSLTADQRKLLERWTRLNDGQKEIVFQLIDRME